MCTLLGAGQECPHLMPCSCAGQNLLSDSFCIFLISDEDLCHVFRIHSLIQGALSPSLQRYIPAINRRLHGNQEAIQSICESELSPLLVHNLSLLNRNICSTFVLLFFPWLTVRAFGFCSMEWGHIVTLPWWIFPSLPLSWICNPNDSHYASKYCPSLNYFIFVAITFECYYSNISGFSCQGTVTDNFINLLCSYSAKKTMLIFYYYACL